tara:strand:+ start:458 stop:853 length:396 start_codon:yes stop_codon:yes gene_type:complete
MALENMNNLSWREVINYLQNLPMDQEQKQNLMNVMKADFENGMPPSMKYFGMDDGEQGMLERQMEEQMYGIPRRESMEQEMMQQPTQTLRDVYTDMVPEPNPSEFYRPAPMEMRDDPRNLLNAISNRNRRI